MFSTVLIANRGEIAVRVIRTLRRMGIESVAVYSDADAGALHVREADRAVRIGPAAAAESYLSIEAILDAARRTGAEAVHPGYGFLAENVEFARACEREGIAFIGPREHALEVMGDKIRAKQQVAEYGVPLVGGVSEPGLSDDELIEAARDMVYPALIKPSAGGGGKGMHRVDRFEDLPETLAAARRVAKQSFGDDTLLIEQLIETPRHIEVQVLADQHGNVIHLGERECSLQRRHQKVIEEAPSALLDEATRARIGESAVNAARAVDYVGAGTVEFLVSDADPETFYFMEMNTRLQVEHPVTEMATGADLVEQQVRIAAGESLRLRQEDVRLNGHAVEARIYAESPARGFLPTEGTVLRLEEPRGRGIRMDSSLVEGLAVGLDYDPMLAKAIAWGATRREAFERLAGALERTAVLGVETNIEFLHALVSHPEVLAGRLDTGLIERIVPEIQWAEADEVLEQLAREFAGQEATPAFTGGGTAWNRDGFALGARLSQRPRPSEASDRTVSMALGEGSADTAAGVVVHVTEGERTFALPVRSRAGEVARMLQDREHPPGETGPELRSPMPGTVVAVQAESGSRVEEGQTVLAVEAMKMEHRITASIAGTVTVLVGTGDQVSLDQVVARIEPDDQTAHPSPSGASDEAPEQK